MVDFEANFTLEQQPTIEADFSMTVINTDHDALTNRDLPDQHPISAITGLQEALDNIPDDYITDAELEAALLDKQDVISDLTTIRSGAALGATSIQPNDNISELNNNVGYITGITSSDVTTALGYTPYNATNPNGYQENVIETVKVNGVALTPTSKAVDISVPTTADDVGALPSSTKYGANMTLSINSTTYVITAQLKDQDGNNLGTAQTIDLPLESVVVSGSYDDTTKKIILTLQNGSTVEFSVADLVSGLQTEITSSNKLDADLVDDSTSINKFVTSNEKSLISTSLQPNDNISELTNDAGYTSNIGTVTSVNNVNPVNGNVTLSIPTVNDATLTITQGGVSKGTFTANAGSDVTIDLDAGGSSYSAGTGIDITSDVISVDSTVVTTNTDQDITGIKTFVGEKRIKFKQSASGNKLGFTLYDNNNKEAAAFEYKPNAINSYPLMYLGQYIGSSSVSYVSTPIYVGFRLYDWANTASYNLVAPLAKDAKSSFSLTGSYKTFYLPLGVTDGNTTVTTASTGLLNISSILPTVNNATLTITQGGTTKGTFTANASSNVTIDLDAGGGSTPSNMVTTDTAQTITGTKTFSGDSWITKIKNTTVTYNYAPASDVWTSIAFVDANDMQMGTVDCWRQPDNSTVMQLNVFGYSGYWGSNLGQSLQFGVDSSNNVFALAPNPRANPNSNEIATVSWVNGSSSDVVHKSNTETITGTKTFEGNQWITKFKNTTVAYNVAPVSGDVSTSIAFVDMYDNAMGTVDCWRYRDNSTEMDFGIFAANGAWISSTLKIYADANGNASAHAPTPPAGSNGDNIATTAWVNTTISGKQDTLVSGTNIKTINNTSILGSGNISVGGATLTYDSTTETITFS